MQTGTCRPVTSLAVIVGLLVLAGGFSGVRFTAAQTQRDCPLPENATSSSFVLPVTAQQVDDGSASLRDFALAARERYRVLHETVATLEGSFQIQCFPRLLGSSWRSDGTYLVILSLDGRVFQHAANMALSGRLLRPAIFGAVLEALGVDPAAFTAFDTAVQALRESPPDGGMFTSGDASGYALVNERRLLPSIWLVGLDLGEEHLVPVEDEDLDYGSPEVTAEDVVDRESLAAFVEETWDYILRVTLTGSISALSKMRIALRDENGPWKHGDVYLYVLEPDSNVIVFHGAFPNRYELRPLVPLARDAVTGELVLPQILEAAESSPEGGFVTYHFDDPEDDTDSVQIPKVGHAREFVLRGPESPEEGTGPPLRYIIGSGFYLRPDGVFVQRLLSALEGGETSVMFAVTTPEDGDAVRGDMVPVSATQAPTDTVHFAYRPAGSGDAFTYAGAAQNRDGVASFPWDTLDLPDDDYELAALYTEDDGYTVVYDSIEVSVDNVPDGGGGGCAVALPLSGGGPLDPTLPAAGGAGAGLADTGAAAGGGAPALAVR